MSMLVLEERFGTLTPTRVKMVDELIESDTYSEETLEWVNLVRETMLGLPRLSKLLPGRTHVAAQCAVARSLMAGLHGGEISLGVRHAHFYGIRTRKYFLGMPLWQTRPSHSSYSLPVYVSDFICRFDNHRYTNDYYQAA